uniref:3,2-trans-enoyl-CoA isomerase, mitochondrial n=1 Tax=Caligus clemensi TaxID=344056 RepID=C1C0F4_CALCM|nr:3,2-trans-enoyl-CoA isomerase, mitochondrial precursor [Caligus clemensi]
MIFSQTLFHSSLRICGRSLRSRTLVSLSRTPDHMAIVELNRPPVNALSIEFLDTIEKTFRELSEDDSVKGIILTSFSDRIFSSGLDLQEIQEEHKLDSLGASFRNVANTLYGSITKPFGIVISGHAPAGGTLLAMCADYRVATPNSILGLNESRIGILVPEWMSFMYEGLMGPRQAELGLMLGSLFPADKALKLGLIDEIAENKEVALASCQSLIRRLMTEPETNARELSKKLSRERTIKSLHADKRAEQLVSFFKSPEVQANIKLYVDSLKKRK